MNPRPEFTTLANATAVAWAGVPESTAHRLVTATAEEVRQGGRLCAWFGVPAQAGVPPQPGDSDTFDRPYSPSVVLVCILAYDAENLLAVGRSKPVAGSYSALTPHCLQAHLFEREVWEQHRVVPTGHPWLKPVRLDHGPGPAVGDFFRVEGAEVHEVAVGPVHAGIIEPGHFRFQCTGEEVLHLEIALGYQHRGVEEAASGGPHRATLCQMETVAGDATVAHATAHAMLLECLAGTEAPHRAQWVRALALELERLANHTGDLGALANDVAFLPASAACGKLRGDFLNLTASLCGNRFGRGLIRPGGCRRDLDPDRAERLMEDLARALAGTQRAASWLWDSSTVRSRFEGTGAVSGQTATEIGLVGPAARACGLVRDVRYDHPAGWHRFAQIPVAVWPGGDVFARARVRWLEIQRAGQFLLDQIATPPDGPLQEDCGRLAPETLGVALVEGWRGETCHAALTDRASKIRRYKIVDPSFHNWTGLALALRRQAISDFPLCNKSFNLSYCGFDL